MTFNSRVGLGPMEILRFEQRFEVVVGVSLVHVKRKSVRHRQCRGPKA